MAHVWVVEQKNHKIWLATRVVELTKREAQAYIEDRRRRDTFPKFRLRKYVREEK